MAHLIEVTHGDAPLLVSIPHAGTDIPTEVEVGLRSPWLARKDADWRIDNLYDFASELGATIVRTSVSRTVIDVNRDPSGASLYPGQATTELCPTTTFDGEPLYRRHRLPTQTEIARRRRLYFDPYHAHLDTEIERLRRLHRSVVLYDCHSIRSVVPRLFEGELPHVNIGTNAGASCSVELQREIELISAASSFNWVANGRFKGGWITRRHGRPRERVHAIQIELACRGYLDEPVPHVDETNWPAPYDAERAAPMRALLTRFLETCIAFAGAGGAQKRIP